MAASAKLSILLLLGVFCAGPQAAAQVSFDRTNWPLYVLEGGADSSLEVELTEKPYQQTDQRWEYGPLRANAGGFDDESVPAAELLMQYLSRLQDGNLEGISEFFVPGSDPEEVLSAAQTLREQIGQVAEVEFVSEWLFLESKTLLVRLKTVDGASSARGFAFRMTDKGFRLDQGSRDAEGSVFGLHRFLASEIDRGQVEGYSPRPFGHTIPLGEGLFGSLLSFDGKLFEAPAEWITLGTEQTAGDVRAYVESVLGNTAAASDSDFLALWCDPDRGKLSPLAEARSAEYLRFKAKHSSSGQIKHVLTMNLGSGAAHYFLDQDQPDRARVIFLSRQGKSLCITRGPANAHFRDFLNSDLIKDGVRALWSAQG